MSDIVVEELAVIRALEKARELIVKFPGQFKHIHIYTDSHQALRTAENCSSPIGRYMLDKASAIHSRQANVKLSLHWCPGHSKVPGNVLADRIAGLACGFDYKDMQEIVDLSDDEDGRWDEWSEWDGGDEDDFEEVPDYQWKKNMVLKADRWTALGHRAFEQKDWQQAVDCYGRTLQIYEVVGI
jgi:hypothetical protein